MMSLKEFFTRYPSPVSFIKQKLTKKKDEPEFDDYAFSRRMAAMKPVEEKPVETVKSFFQTYPTPVSYFQKKIVQPIKEHKIEVGKPILPELAPREFRGDPEKKLDFITNTILGLPEATIQTLPFVHLLRQPRPITLKGRVKTLGMETRNFVKGIGQLVAMPAISAVSLLKNEPIEQQIKRIPFLGEVPTYEKVAYEQLIAGVSPLEVGISLGAQAAITAGIIGAPALRITSALKPRVITRTTKVGLSKQDISDITRGTEVSPQALKAFKQAVGEGIEIAKILRKRKPVIVKTKTPNAIGEILYRPVGKGMFERVIPKATRVIKRKGLPGLVPEEPAHAFGMTIRRMKEVGKPVSKIPKELEYMEWLKKQPEALEKIKEFTEKSKTITNIKDKIKYLKEAKHKLDTEFSKKFAERKKPVVKFGEAEAITEAKRVRFGDERFIKKPAVRPKAEIPITQQKQKGMYMPSKEYADTNIFKQIEKEIKPKETFDKYLEKEFGKPDKIQEQFLKEATEIKREVEGDLFKSIKELGGIKSFRKGELAEEMKPIPINLRNNKTGSTLDELATELNQKGFNFADGEELRNAILEIKTEARPIKEPKDIVRVLKTIKKIAPRKAKVSQRLINKLHRLKFPKITAETKSIRRALETGKFKPTREWLARPSKLYREGKLPPVVSKYLSGKISKVLKEERKYQPTISPEAVPKKALSGFDNFIDLTKIKRKDIPYKKMDIAEIVRGDKMFPAIRMSGFYATKEIQTAEIRNEYKQLLSPHLMALQQDGYKLGSKFGVIFKKVWIPTQKAIRNEIEFTKQNHNEGVKIFKKHNYKLTDKSLKRFSDLMEFGKGTPKEMELVQEMRQYLDNLRDQDNAVREITKRDKMGYIKDYVPHIQKAVLWNELLSNVATISDSLDFIIPNQVKNPFAYKRLGEEMPNAERNFGILLDRYVRAVAKDIYITPAIENIKAYNGVLKNRDLINASKYWDEYIRFGLVGKQYKIDTALSIGQTGGRISQKWNDMVNKAFLTGKIAWNIGTQPLSYIMYTGMEAGEINAVKAVYKSFKKPLRQYVKENSDVLAIKSNDVLAVATGEGRNIQNRIYRTKIDKYNDFISMLSAIEERELTLASYIAGLDRAKDLGYKGQEALWFADLTAARTQSMYNRQNRALILDSDIARTLFPFQSFSVESFNHLREIFTKESGAVALNARQRTGKLFRLLIGIYLSSLYYKFLTGKKKTTLGTFFPFVGNYIDMLIAQAKGETYYGGRSPITPVQIGSDVIKGSRDFVKYGDLKKLRKVGVNFGLSLFGIGGGGQINNIIDGLMADIEGEVRNVKGNKMFNVEDTLSKIKAPIFGVWATKEGIEYWLPAEEKETLSTGRKLKSDIIQNKLKVRKINPAKLNIRRIK